MPILFYAYIEIGEGIYGCLASLYMYFCKLQFRFKMDISKAPSSLDILIGPFTIIMPFINSYGNPSVTMSMINIKFFRFRVLPGNPNTCSDHSFYKLYPIGQRLLCKILCCSYGIFLVLLEIRYCDIRRRYRMLDYFLRRNSLHS